MKKFWITFFICWLVFALSNVWLSAEPKVQIGHSYWHRVGFPFPVLVEAVQNTAAGRVVTTITDRRPWGHLVNAGLWFFLSYRFARWVDRSGAAWWRGGVKPPAPSNA